MVLFIKCCAQRRRAINILAEHSRQRGVEGHSFIKKSEDSVMKTLNQKLLRVLALTLLLLPTTTAFAEEAGSKHKYFSGDFRLRYESASQDNALPDADALTFRSRLAIKSPSYSGFSGLVEVENVFALIDDFAVPVVGDRLGEFSVIADPDVTEIDQAFIQYKNENFSAKLGRQVLTLDGHRFIGHVGWRQDRQTFDGLVVNYKTGGFDINFSYLDKRNRIFADDGDIDSSDTILNTSYATPIGKLTGYAYLLEVDANDTSLDTYGVSLRGSRDYDGTKLIYGAELAQQETGTDLSTDYLQLELGLTYAGVTGKISYELLSSDNGAVGFATPLATLHKFNGWTDQFLATPAQGLEEFAFRLSGNFQGGKWLAVYQDFSSDENLDGADDLGSEVGVQYTRKIYKKIAGGIKYSDYSAGNSAFNRVDTQRFWLWAGYKF